jgi:replicative DNA helicase Mcm
MTGESLHELDRCGDWANFLKISYKKEMGIIAREYPHVRSLVIKYADIERWGKTGIALADELMENPGKVIEDIQEAIKANALIRTANNKEIKNLNIRFTGIAKKRLLRDLRYEDVNTMVAVEAAIVHRASEVNPRLIESVSKCPGGHFTVTRQSSHIKFKEPEGCATDGCQYKKLELLPKRSKFTDQQRIKIQDSPEGLKPGQQPQLMDIVCLDDVCDQIYAGERATFNAIVRSTQRIIRGEKSTVFDLHLDISSIESGARDFEEISYTDDEELKIKEIAKSGNALEQISRSIAPSIWGNEDIKKALALQMFGGVTKIYDDGQRERGEIHITLLGDYGVAKTQLAKYAITQSPRGIFISAVSASGPGLIGATKQDPEEGGRWYVEAGELPQADLGVAAIDEIDKADKETLNTLYNVMQDGECRISKAAKRTLKARTSLILCGNPKYQKFDLFADIIDQITIPPALINRCDLVFIMVDSKQHDKEISEHISNANYYGQCKAAGKPEKISDEQKASITPPISQKLLKQYIAYAKNNIHPIMNQAAMAKINAYYVKIRGSTVDESKAPITPRQQQSIIRLSEAMAKLRLSPEVTLKDVDAVLEIFDKCIKMTITDPKTGKIDAGRMGQGVSSNKASMIAAIKDIVKGEPGIKLNLLMAKLDERNFKNEHEIKAVLKMMTEAPAALYEPKYECYRLV